MSEIWYSEGLKHITPKGIDFPEGFDVVAFLRDWVGECSVLDYGCGRGRLAEAFAIDKYHGFDINPEAIEKARSDSPGYSFSGESIAGQELTLLYTVALHVKDFGSINLDTPRVIIAEIMNPERARPDGMPPAFNRSKDEYIELMSANGYGFVAVKHVPYKYYPGESITFLEFSQC